MKEKDTGSDQRFLSACDHAQQTTSLGLEEEESSNNSQPEEQEDDIAYKMTVEDAVKHVIRADDPLSLLKESSSDHQMASTNHHHHSRNVNDKEFELAIQDGGSLSTIQTSMTSTFGSPGAVRVIRNEHDMSFSSIPLEPFSASERKTSGEVQEIYRSVEHRPSINNEEDTAAFHETESLGEGEDQSLPHDFLSRQSTDDANNNNSTSGATANNLQDLSTTASSVSPSVPLRPESDNNAAIITAVLVEEPASTAVAAPDQMPNNNPDDQHTFKALSIVNQRRFYIIVAILILGVIGIILAIVVRQPSRGQPATPQIIVAPPPPTPFPTLLPTSMPTTLLGKGIAQTTRFWDCSGGACGCGHLVPLSDPDRPTYCRGNGLFRAPLMNPWGATYYGTAAVSKFLGGSWWLSEACGKCWKLTGTTNARITNNSTNTTIIVKGTNYCPNKCGNGPHFVIAAPGFDSNPERRYEVCDEREQGEKKEAWSACEQWMTGNSTDPTQNCNCSLFSDPVLRESCENFLELGWDDPDVDYEELSECPEELGRLPCWDENGKDWPLGIPEFCASPYGSGS